MVRLRARCGKQGLRAIQMLATIFRDSNVSNTNMAIVCATCSAKRTCRGASL